MKQFEPIAVFGEVLFDCFDEVELLGGAPFNVAWHLQALGDAPLFVSAIGDDAHGEQIMKAMQQWGLDAQAVQLDDSHPTGRVNVTELNHQPHYDIQADCAYDFIRPKQPSLPTGSLLYHGSLALRSDRSRETLEHWLSQSHADVFMDVNLRDPWWQKESVFVWLEHTRWAKLNESELRQLGFDSADLSQDMLRMQTQFQMEQLIVTRGEGGACVRCNDGQFFESKPTPPAQFIDTVGAGDAFSAMYIHGLRAGWSVDTLLECSQAFAAAMIGQRGGICDNPDFYQPFRD